jgi:integrase
MLAFDARAARLLAPGEHVIFPEAPGLRLVATASRRAWAYRFKSPVDGRMRQTKLGEWPAMPPAAALAAWERARASRAAGVDPAAEKRAARAARAAAAVSDALTVRRVCDDYLEALRGTVAAKTFRDIDRLLSTELDSVASLPAASVTRAVAFDLLDPMRDRPVLAQRLRQTLGAAWDRALDAGRLPPETPNWWRLVMRGKLASKGRRISGRHVGASKRVLSEDEVGVLLRGLGAFSRDMQDVLTLYLWTGCRGAEIVAMERGEVAQEPDGYWWTVPKAKLKTRRNPLTVDLRVPLAGRAAAVVLRRLEGRSKRWVFPSVGRTGHIGQVAASVAVARARHVGLAHWAPHDLRRTARTMLAGLGCPTEVAEAILGHLQPGVKGVYNRHGYDAERRVWLTRLAERLESLAS